jgi:ribose/xylose/arabinose/galactoside ABC-type transport system permease subunit
MPGSDLNANPTTDSEASRDRIVPAIEEAAASQPFGDLGSRLRSFLKGQIILLLVIVLILAGSRLSPVFLTPRNLYNILWAISVLGIVSLGQTLLLITRNFDMSVSMVVPFAGIVCVGAQIAGWGLWPSIFAGLLAATLIGVLNGAIVVITRANAFLVTLGMQTLVYAIALILTEARTWYTAVPEFGTLGRGQVFGFLHYSVLIFLGLALILQLFLVFTRNGHYLYVLGANEEAGRRFGISVNRVKIATFAFCSFTAGLAGLIMTSRLGQTRAGAAEGMDFDSVIAVVLGGTSLFGGSGGTLRTVLGVVVLGILNNVMVLAGIPYEAQWIGKGVVFLLVAGGDAFFKRWR